MDKIIEILGKKIIKLRATSQCCNFIESYLEGYIKFIEADDDDNDLVFINVIDQKNEENLDLVQKEYINFDIHYDQKALLRVDGEDREVIFLGHNHKVYFSNKMITIVLNVEDSNRNYIPMRIIREIYKIYLVSNGYVEYHSSSVLMKNKGIVFIGNKGSGKTTNMILSIVKYHANFISNDKTFINFNRKCFFGFPMALNIKKDILNIFPNLKNLFENPSHYQHTSWKEFKNKEKFTFSINEFVRFTNSDVKPKASIDYLIILTDEMIKKCEVLNIDDVYSLIKIQKKSTNFAKWEELIKGTLPIKQSDNERKKENRYKVITTNKYYVDEILNEIEKGLI